MASVENRHPGLINIILIYMDKHFIVLPESISLAEMMQVKGGLSNPSTTTEANDDIIIRCEPGPAVSCNPGNAVGKGN